MIFWPVSGFVEAVNLNLKSKTTVGRGDSLGVASRITVVRKIR